MKQTFRQKLRQYLLGIGVILALALASTAIAVDAKVQQQGLVGTQAASKIGSAFTANTGILDVWQVEDTDKPDTFQKTFTSIVPRLLPRTMGDSTECVRPSDNGVVWGACPSGGATAAPMRIGWNITNAFPGLSNFQATGSTLGTTVPDVFDTAIQPTGFVAVWVGAPQEEIVDIVFGNASLLNDVFGNQASGNALTLNGVEGTVYVSPSAIQVQPRVRQTWGVLLTYNPFTAALESKLLGIQAGAEVNVNADFNCTSGDCQILNPPTDVFVNGGSVNGNVLTLTRTGVGGNVTISGLPGNDGVVTAGTVSGTTLTLDRSVGADVVITGLPTGGAGNTNISVSRAAEQLTIVSSTGTNGIVVCGGHADGAGALCDSQADKLADIETGATADQTAAEIHTLIESDTADWRLKGNVRVEKGLELDAQATQAHFDLHPTVTGNERLRLTLGEDWPGNTVGPAGNTYRISFVALTSPPTGNVRILSVIANTVTIEFTEGTTTFGNVMDAVATDDRLSAALLNGAVRSHFLADTGNNTSFSGGAIGTRYPADFSHSSEVRVPVETQSDSAVQRGTLEAVVANINDQLDNITEGLHPSTTVSLAPTLSGAGNSVFTYNLASLVSNDLVAPGWFTFSVNNIAVRQTLQNITATTGRAVVQTGSVTQDTIDFHFIPTDPTATLSSQYYFFHWSGHLPITESSSNLTITFSITGPSGATGLSLSPNPHNNATISGRANYDIDGAVISAVPQRFYFKQAGQATFYPTARPTGPNLEKAGDSGQASNRHRVRFDGTVVRSAPSGITPATAGFAFKNSSNDKFIVDGFNGETAAKPDNHSFELGAGTWSLRVESLLGAAFTLYTLQLWQVNPTSGSNLDAVQAMWVSSSGGSETLVFEWSDITLTAAASFYFVFVLGAHENGPGFYNLAVTKH